MKVLITGAWGMVGQAAMGTLVDENVQVVCFDLPTRSNLKAARKAAKSSTKVQASWGDVRDPVSLMKAMEGCDAVIHLAAIIPPRADHVPELAQSINLGGTLNVIDCMKKVIPRSRLVYSSSIAVYGDRLAEPLIRVEDPLQESQGDHYGRLKIEAESAIRQSGLEFTILRLSYIAGPQNLVWDPILFRMPLATHIEICLAEDAGRACAHGAQVESAGGRTFNIGGGVACRTTFGPHVQTMFRILGLGRIRPKVLPYFARRGYHCGWLVPQGEEEILHYQRLDLADYYQKLKKQSRITSFFTRLVSPVVWAFIARLGRYAPGPGA